MAIVTAKNKDEEDNEEEATTLAKHQDHSLGATCTNGVCGRFSPPNEQQQQQQQQQVEGEPTILEASLFGVACATMIYTFADLRLMSATGYACTPFEHLRVASDACYGSCKIPQHDTKLEVISRLKTTPANMLLSLLRELRREAAFFRDTQCQLAKNNNNSSSNNSKKRFKRKTSRRDSLTAAAPMVFLTNGTGGDHQTIDPDREPTRGRENKLLDSIECILKSSLKETPETRPENDARTPHTKTGCCLEMNFGLQYSQLLLHNLYRDAIQAKLLTPEGLPPPPPHTDADGYSFSSSSFTANRIVVDPETDGALYLLDQVIEQQQEKQADDANNNNNNNNNNDDLSPVYQLLAQQFKPNSIAAGLLTGNCTELVWFHDYFPAQEAVFAIMVNHSRRAIQVVFRGTVTVENWVSNLDFLGIEVPNPIPQDYPNKSDSFKLHNGFQSYVLRERKDTQNQPWWKIICDLVDYYGQLNFDGDYQLTTSGHSLGGACCTIFGFYASLDPRMTSSSSCGGHKPVLIETFAAPMVGCHGFADAFRFQERSGKLRHARYYNRYDIVPKLPLNLKVWNERGSPWAHTGIGIELVGRHPHTDGAVAAWSIFGVWERLWLFWSRIFQPPMRLFQNDDKSISADDDITKCLVNIQYAAAKGYWESVWVAIRNNICFHVDLVNCGRNHSMTEYQERLQLAMALDTRGCLSRQTMESLYSQYALLAPPGKGNRKATRRIESRQDRTKRLQRTRGLALLVNAVSRACIERA